MQGKCQLWQPSCSPASQGASSRSIFVRWQQCSLSSSSAGLAVICAAKIRLCRPCQYFFRLPDRRSLLGARDACVASLDLSVMLGRRTFNRVVEGARRGSVQALPIPSRRVLRIWGHWAHLMTTVHRGRSSDGGFVAQFLWARKSVCASEPGRFRTFFGLLYIFRHPASGRPIVVLITSS